MKAILHGCKSEGSTSVHLLFIGLLKCLRLSLLILLVTAMPTTSYLDDGKTNAEIIPIHLGFVVKVGIGAAVLGPL